MRTEPAGPGEVLFGVARRRVLALLFGHSDEAYHLRQIVRETGLSPSGVHRELAQLAEAGIVTRRQQGRQVYFQANSASPIFNELKSLVVKTAGVTDVLREALAPLAADIDVAFVYGSVARGEERRASDVDLLVVGDASFAALSQTLAPAQRRLSREVNPTVYTSAEFRRKLAAGNHFVRSVTGREKLFLFGNEHDLRRLGK
ncbi:MAG TPA: nucleotidyltransferase domain-containing protein [bacterium]|nr:nucleotidyltransferase domain-containing protein [bacterium]